MDDEAKAGHEDGDSQYDSGEVGSLHDFIDDSAEVEETDEEDLSEHEKKARAKGKGKVVPKYVVSVSFQHLSSPYVHRQTQPAKTSKGRAQRYDAHALYLCTC